MLSFTTSSGKAQGYDPECERVLLRVCGPVGSYSIRDCAEDYDFWSNIPEFCEADIQTMIETEREVYGQDPDALPDMSEKFGEDSFRGFSYGGILRGGPETGARRLASLYDGQPIEILENTGVWMDGYEWYRVRTDENLIGFHWGGIFCQSGGLRDNGILSYC
ncbi:hypothetical protein FP2506_02220 [Fulvimarina pelagi HTCC2506]|uniref:SH3b domain-containing protein n=2 Tax=Fulvimarina pelagi TaxID=217511 RepID=Q0FYH6_9HYPH|nr:hypothetical protein FP2506_02220 [Fulvimarina pelagi HTCC2506]